MGLLGMLGSWLAPRAAPDAALDAAMARAIETVDPLLKAVSGHYAQFETMHSYLEIRNAGRC